MKLIIPLALLICCYAVTVDAWIFTIIGDAAWVGRGILWMAARAPAEIAREGALSALGYAIKKWWASTGLDSGMPKMQPSDYPDPVSEASRMSVLANYRFSTSFSFNMNRAIISLEASRDLAASQPVDTKNDVFTFTAPGTTGNKPRSYPIETGMPSLEQRMLESRGYNGVKPQAPPGITQAQSDQCLDDAYDAMLSKKPMKFRSPANPGEKGSIQIDNVPKSCIKINDLLKDGPATLLPGTSSLKWTGLSLDQILNTIATLNQAAAQLGLKPMATASA